MSDMKAMILAAGFGTRLFPLTIDRTKPAIPFLGKPLVGYVAEYVARFGFKEVIVNLHHQPDSVIDALGDGSDFGVKIYYTLEEPDILGTAGALVNARRYLGDEAFLIVNGKIITDIDISKALETHKRSGALATMVLKQNPRYERFTVVETQDGLVTGFGGFPARPDADAADSVPLMFTGIHIVEPVVFDYIEPGVSSDIVQVFYRKALAEGKPIAAHVADGAWYELSTIPRYLDISLAMMGQRQTVFKGDNCLIAQGASVRNSIIWDDVVIGEGAKLDRTIIADGVRIEAGSVFDNAAIVRAEMLTHTKEIPEKALTGQFVGDNYVVSLNR
jgi:NDP-sugar pyrophosphorylase family protein